MSKLLCPTERKELTLLEIRDSTTNVSTLCRVVSMTLVVGFTMLQLAFQASATVSVFHDQGQVVGSVPVLD